MKLILEPTVKRDKHPHSRVEIELPFDDCTMDDMVGMFRSALLAQGFHPDTVAEYLEAE